MARELVSLTGLDRDSPAFRLYQKAKRLGTWDPAAIDFSIDFSWPALTEAEQDLLLRRRGSSRSGALASRACG
jgi:ribonucleoside-diphosphate reductase beta chain